MTEPKTVSDQETSIDRPEPISSSSAGRLENLLSSPYWPLGSSFLKLLNFPPVFRPTFRLGGASAPIPITANSKDDQPKLVEPGKSAPLASDHMEVDLDGSPIGSDIGFCEASEAGKERLDALQDEDEDDDHTLEELLVKPNSSEKRNAAAARKPSLSDRLTEPSTWKQGSYGERSSREQDHRHSSRPPFSSIPRNTYLNIKGMASLKRSGHAPDPVRTSSNLIECNTKLHPWGSKRPSSIPTGPQSSFPPNKRARLLEVSQKSSEPKKWIRDRYQDSDEEQDGHRIESIPERYHWSKPGYQKSEQPYDKSEKSYYKSDRSHAKDENSHNKAEKSYYKSDRSYQKDENSYDRAEKSYQKTGKPYRKHEKLYQKSDAYQKPEYYNLKSFDPPISHASEAQSRASSAAGWKKHAGETGPTKMNRQNTTKDFSEEVEDRERRWMQEFQQYDVARSAHTRSISPPLSSHRRSPSRHSSESDNKYYTLTKIAPALEQALHRAVFSWINQAIAEALCRLGLWLEQKKIWSSTAWGSIRVDQLEKVVDMTYERGLEYLMFKCHTSDFMELLQKPVQSGIFNIHKDPHNDAWYIKFGRDFTPIGLLYRPLVKGYRRHLTDSKSQLPIQAGKFVRQYLMCHSNEEDLLFLFKKDKDPMRCLERAEKDGIVELSDQPPSRGPRPGVHCNKTWYNEIPVENKYLRLKSHWLSNKDSVDPPLFPSPTITAQTCNTALNDDDDSPSTSAGKTHKQKVSNPNGSHGVPAIDRRNSDNTSVSANTSITTTDPGMEHHHDHPPQGHENEDARSHRSDIIEIIKPNKHPRSHSSNVDALIESVIEQLAQDLSRRRQH
ncbi:hypothetical protein PSTG_10735 [Puccinia striiformis f. sp. tritici PST-78]|uniref:Uncharacterized protein n=1 Tax=Puccinia striiformis f. sp. tritici PST-78 TaxID=1165861 RepID=A0A0L0V9H1_9BASI|nr:hypothetical protein PSTG_10735 [Puccinia striiformis f. sp. tritici PST-78]